MPLSPFSRKRSLPTALPEQVAWLEHVDVELAPSSTKAKRSFDLTVRFHDQSCDTRTQWTLERTLDDFGRLQKRLLAALQVGHACHAECQWLYATVKKHFPRKSLLPVSSASKSQERARALLRILTTLRASLLNRGNHGCSVLLDGLAREFSAFLVGDRKGEASFASERRGSLSSLTSSDDDSSEVDGQSFYHRESFDRVDSTAPPSCRVCTVSRVGAACLAPVMAIAFAAAACPSCGHQQL